MDGRNTGRYREANYEKLKAITKLKCVSGLQSLQKVNTLQKINEQKKDETILQQHKTCWKKELVHLNNLYKKTVYEVELSQNGLPWEQNMENEFFSEVEKYKMFLENDYLTFTKSTIKPIWDLREDMQIWLEGNKHNTVSGNIIIYKIKRMLCAS